MYLDEIRRMPMIYGKGSMYYSYEYHYDPRRPKKIFLEFNIMCEAQYLKCYELREDKGVFLLIIHESVGTGAGSGKSDPECEVAGHNEPDAIEYMIKKIIEQPASNQKDNEVDIAALEASLREALSRKAA